MSEIIESGDEPLDDAPLEPTLAPAEAPKQIDPETEALARRYGWRPREESTLPDASYMDAERFLAAGKTRLRIQEDRLREADGRIAAAEALARTAAETVRRQERERYARELEEIRAGKAEAVKTADEEAYAELDRREQSLRPPQAGPDPSVAAYAETSDGAWIKDAYLRNQAAALLNANPDKLALSPMDQVKWAREKIQEYYPHKFAAPQPRETDGRFATSRVDGGSLATGRANPTHGLSAEEYAEVAKNIASGPLKGAFKNVGEYVEYAKKIGVLE